MECKRYAVNLEVGYSSFYGDNRVLYETLWFDTEEEAEMFVAEHHAHCTEVFDTENLPF
jgi:hypothetical protein